MVSGTEGVAQRDIWWAELPDPSGSTPGFRRPVIIVQSDAINASRLHTVLCVPLTSNLRWKMVPWNMELSARSTGLDKDSVAQPNMILPIDQSQLVERIGRVSERQLRQLFQCLDIALGR